MAKNYYTIRGAIQIAKETCNLLRSNTIFLFVVLAAMIPYTLLLFANIFSLISVLQNLCETAISLLHMDSEALEYLRQAFNIQVKTFLIVFVEMLYFHLMAMFSLLSLVSTVYVSSMAYLEKDLKLKELGLKINHFWVRPLTTWFYVFLVSVGLVLLILREYIFEILQGGALIMFAVVIILVLLVATLSFYLALVWNVGLVISVTEDLCGLETFGNGKKLVGFILMFIFVVPFNAVYISIFLTEYGREVDTVLLFLVIFLAMNFVVMVNTV
ncbi:hypothetical protein ACHQM5_030286 [Ranunculus cassubicifolius]